VIATSVDVGLYPAWQRALLVPVATFSMVAGGLFSGVLIGLLGELSHPAPEALQNGILIIVGVWACVWDLVGARVPTNHWQVPRSWARWPWPTYHAAFGFILGLGWLTVVPFASYYLLVAVLIVVGNPTTSALMMTLFGLARAVPLLLLSAGIFREACPAGFGARSVARRAALHQIADSRPMRVCRALVSTGIMIMLFRHS
jgi:hypothetical protein